MPGIAEYAECVDIGAMEFDKLAAFAKEKEIDLCIVGMDDPLVGGLVDVLGGGRHPYFRTRGKTRRFWKAPKHFPKI